MVRQQAEKGINVGCAATDGEARGRFLCERETYTHMMDVYDYYGAGRDLETFCKDNPFIKHLRLLT